MDQPSPEHLLILDDWLRDPLTASQSRDLLEIVDDRYGRTSTLVASQVPVEDWLARFPDPTLADAVLDRLVHNAYRLELKGDSMRKKRSPLAQKPGCGYDVKTRAVAADEVDDFNWNCWTE